MGEHLTREQIAALLDKPDTTAGGHAHLDVCTECASEFEAMSRTRMALSALPDLKAPEGAWERIRADLASRDAAERRTAERRATAAWWSPQGRWSAPLTAAAILVLFLGGLGVGRMLGPAAPAGPAGAGETATAAADDAGPPAVEPAETPGLSALAAEYPEYVRTVADLRELKAGGPSSAEISADPALAAERLTRLDALIEASREALREAPADPALNDFLFDVVDERASVAGQLDQTLRQASLEY